MTNSDRCALIDKELTKAQRNFLEYCLKLDWGKIEVIVKDGEPVMVTQAVQDIKLD